MKSAFIIFLLVFYSFGTFFLPMGNFSTMQDLPEMYRHCKATEDKDMTLIDFVTDHLVNIDGIFDKHDKGDEQKPHESKPLEHQVQTNTLLISCLVFSIKITLAIQIKSAIPLNNFLPSDYVSEIFRPPIA